MSYYDDIVVQHWEPYTAKELRHERAVLVLALLDLMTEDVDHTTPSNVVRALAQTHEQAKTLRACVECDRGDS